MTATPWERIPYGPWAETVVVPQVPPDASALTRKDLPATLRPVAGDGVVQHPVFDPSAGHHAMGMRLSEPRFADARTGEAWFEARRQALEHVLEAIAGSEWAGHLVLRGSMLLKAWFGDAAREPGDLDFVVVPDSWGLADDRTDAMLDGIARAAEVASCEGGAVRIDAAGAVSDAIWTYDRVPGRRLVLPWAPGAEGLPPGTVQLDFVFNEPLPVPAAPTEIPRRRPGHRPLVLRAATPELSLAWKLLWLVTDMYPEAKDLYDAVLLAESTHLSYDLLHPLLVASEEYPRDSGSIPLDHFVRAATQADWFEFAKDHPGLPARQETAYATRLTFALAPTFAPAEAGTYARLAAAFEHLTAQLRETVLTTSGMGSVGSWLVERSLPAVCAVVITRELLGRGTCSLQDAADVAASFRGARFGEPLYAPGSKYGDPHDIAARLEAVAAGAGLRKC
ncbi:nucleotidyl transferase AbiEii/AbiGii toxin family protein [Streptomyces sp. NPDC026206]|uniref:nucleotidyl transferase AbiEii/AbiGii toxin family protein n=1 Tax=Streptomyces sp. NPDC026206 TaxID=3157089 RepID=UPI00340FE104